MLCLNFNLEIKPKFNITYFYLTILLLCNSIFYTSYYFFNKQFPKTNEK
jgi:hypothetical protein